MRFAQALAAGLLLLAPIAACSQQTKPAKPVRVRAKLDGFDIGPGAGRSPNQVGGASRGLGDVVLYAPGVGKSYSAMPTFYWRQDDPTARYRFRIAALSSPGDALYFAEVMGSSLSYPASAPPLQPGTSYRWTVEPVIDMLGSPASATVVIVGGPEREAVKAALVKVGSKAEPRACARVFVDRRLWYDAVEAYSELIAAHPADADLRSRRAEIYGQLSQTQALAAADDDAANR